MKFPQPHHPGNQKKGEFDFLDPKPLFKKEKPAPNPANFLVIPRFAPFLQKEISGVRWDCYSKTISMDIHENDECNALEWITEMNERKATLSEIEQDHLVVVFLDDDKKEIYRLKLIGLSLTEHKCFLSGPAKKLVHYIQIGYDKLEKIKREKSSEDALNRSGVPETDREWIQVDLEQNDVVYIQS